jgi:hypothetical protein
MKCDQDQLNRTQEILTDIWDRVGEQIYSPDWNPTDPKYRKKLGSAIFDHIDCQAVERLYDLMEQHPLVQDEMDRLDLIPNNKLPAEEYFEIVAGVLWFLYCRVDLLDDISLESLQTYLDLPQPFDLSHWVVWASRQYSDVLLEECSRLE